MPTSSSQHLVCAGLMVVVKQGDDVHLHLSSQFKDRTVSLPCTGSVPHLA